MPLLFSVFYYIVFFFLLPKKVELPIWFSITQEFLMNYLLYYSFLGCAQLQAEYNVYHFCHLFVVVVNFWLEKPYSFGILWEFFKNSAGFPPLHIFSLTTLLLLLHAAMPLFSFLSFTTLYFFSAVQKKCWITHMVHQLHLHLYSICAQFVHISFFFIAAMPYIPTLLCFSPSLFSVFHTVHFLSFLIGLKNRGAMNVHMYFRCT